MKKVVIPVMLLGIILAVTVATPVMQHAAAMPAPVNTEDGSKQTQNGISVTDNHDKHDGEDDDDDHDNHDDKDSNNADHPAPKP